MLDTSCQTKTSIQMCYTLDIYERCNPNNGAVPPAASLCINVKFACHLVSPDLFCQVQILYMLGRVLVD